MKSDVNGCATVAAGSEQWEKCKVMGRPMFQYDYRTPGGELFSCMGRTLEICRIKRNEWLANKEA